MKFFIRCQFFIIALFLSSCWLFPEPEREPLTGQNYLLIDHYRIQNVNNYDHHNIVYQSYADCYMMRHYVLDVSDDGQLLLYKQINTYSAYNNSGEYQGDSSNYILKLYDIPNDSCLWTLDTNIIHYACFTSDMQNIIVTMTPEYYGYWGIVYPYLMNIDGTGLCQISEARISTLPIQYIPNSNYLYYICHDPYAYHDFDIYKMNINTGIETNITNNEDEEFFIAVSSNEEFICVCNGFRDGGNAYIIDQSSGEKTEIIPPNPSFEYYTFPPILSPNDSLVFVNYCDESHDHHTFLYDVEADTFVLDNLPIRTAQFSPDNKYLFFMINDSLCRHDLISNKSEFLYYTFGNIDWVILSE